MFDDPAERACRRVLLVVEMYTTAEADDAKLHWLVTSYAADGRSERYARTLAVA
jgi:hypothetical protein